MTSPQQYASPHTIVYENPPYLDNAHMAFPKWQNGDNNDEGQAVSQSSPPQPFVSNNSSYVNSPSPSVINSTSSPYTNAPY
jgi:hypothetical protein